MFFSESTDDTKIESYLWEIASGPITDGFKLENNEGSMLKLKDLTPGTYKIRLTVTDSAGLKNSTEATVTIEKVWYLEYGLLTSVFNML